MTRPFVGNWYPQLLLNNLLLAIEADYRPGGALSTGSTVGIQQDNTLRGDQTLIQATDANRPKYTTNVQNSRPSLLFDGTNAVMTNAQPRTFAWCMAVFNYTKQATFDTGYPTMAGNNAASGNKMILGNGAGGSTSLTNSGTMILNNGTPVTGAADCNWGAGQLSTFKAMYHLATFTYNTGLSLGGLAYAAANYWQGNLLCLYAGKTALTTTELNMFFNFLNQKYNLY